jgi:opacity protein-like surface antigen
MRLIIVFGFLCITSAVSAQEFSVPSVDNSRAYKWDFSFNILSTESEEAGSSNGSGLDIGSETGWGFGIGYNLNKNFALAFDFGFVEPRYTATLVGEDDVPTKISHKMTISTGQFKGIWNFVDGPLTPYADLGLGWTYIDSNVASSPPTTGCWWDPFWGYVCSNLYNTYSDTSFSYGGGLGVRWQITPGFFLRGSYNLLKIDMSSSVDDLDLNSWRVEIGTSY